MKSEAENPVTDQSNTDTVTISRKEYERLQETEHLLIETAKENGLDPYLYLVWLLKEAPVWFATDRDWAESLLPQYAPDFCRA